ncbi:hypothetical protein CONCODRAFT_7670 [Conidiobolus coronatus NRRL 28638]|uniref:Uncharacterized protein n=1 Tax=Conidiobolus coronatus (strain ATCC 28846 / CBS 209.66 / NRRL 28638) TaxID=796925 RepID=A0A137P4A1_CONC2|nr:hypothetical protein CONCODRAFT_7670 [Conidiobolus coronatus NRRL 28638]|eukprot:KXN69847.1 hypothetical protein CONCODRAFT_7670 [Conidiobolus coronatus NRRL 28638]
MYGAESVNIIGYVGNKQFYCSNVNLDTKCSYNDFSVPPPGVMPGDCKLRDEEYNGNFITKRYDCGSFYDHWRFGCDMFEYNPEKRDA